jgi:DNA-binding beta-propeller fold protein YncE
MAGGEERAEANERWRSAYRVVTERGAPTRRTTKEADTMTRHRSLWATAALGALLALLAACGASVSTGAAATATVSPGETLYVLDGTGAAGRIVAFHPADARPAALATLPAGLTSSDHRRLYAARAQGAGTTVAVYDTRTGAALRSFAIAGVYGTAGSLLGFPDATLSPDGRWLALRSLAAEPGTTIAVVDTQAGAVARTIRLDGDYTMDAIAADGSMLFLLQNVGDAAHHYYVRAYDVTTDSLLEPPVVDKTAINETLMRGYAVARQTTSDGGVDYTLYIDATQNIAFVHALPLVPHGPNPPLFAHCIDLPVGRSGDLLRYYTLALNADETMLYAANAALGLVSAISVEGQNIFNDQVVMQGHFDPGGGAASGAGQAPALYGGAALASTNTLFVAGPHGIWQINAATLSADRDYLAGGAYTGVALSGDGRTLYAADPAHGLMALDLATGQAAPLTGAPAAAPMGIAWVAG